MVRVPSKSVRVAVLALSLCASAALIAWQLARRRAAPTTAVVDIGPALEQLFQAREAAPFAPVEEDEGYPFDLVREPLDEPTAKLFFPSIGGGHYVYDPELYFRCDANLALPQDFPEHPDHGWIIRTNSLGLRDDADPSSEKPDLRILVAGASNAEGMCANSESAANLLEFALRERMSGKTVETLNAGVGSSNFYNYLPVLEHYRKLRPDLFILIANGGTDMTNSLPMERYFDQRGKFPRASKSCEPLSNSDDPFVRSLAGTEMGQVAHLRASPSDVKVAVRIASLVCDRIDELCRADGIRFICVYLPPALAGQPLLFAKQRAEAEQLMQVDDDDLAVSNRMADGWLEFLDRRGIEFVDLRPLFRATGERLYWSSDPHVNLAGQCAIADALLKQIDAR